MGGGVVADGQTISKAAAATNALTHTPPAEGGFSIFWITDTQFLSESNPGLFRQMNHWIVEHWTEYNGRLVIHTGDVVQNGNQVQEWKNANDAMSVLLQNGIPYTWCAGNHDNWILDDETSGWMGNSWGAPSLDPATVGNAINQGKWPMGKDTYGAPGSFNNQAQWVGDYHNGMNTAVSFQANGINFLVITLEWKAHPEVMEWASGIMDDPNYAYHRVVLAPHAYVDAWGLKNDARWGPVIADFVKGFTTLIQGHSQNVFLTLNGHFATDSGYNTPNPIDYRNELMFDRQDCTDYPNDFQGRGVDNVTQDTPDIDKVGAATVTILNFDTANGRINASTYNVYTGRWRMDSANQYSIPMFPVPAPTPPVISGGGRALTVSK